ncbi:MAG: hypothetical protein M1539_02350 [Actinobacteria bacterium]|nr:hypothetical protein [Actinomycetota bacterium]MCL5882807.1 hypothetical protein [Actinomycetota bacterium]
MRIRIILISMLVLVFAGMIAVHAMAASSAATPAGEEYGGSGDQYLGTVTNPTTPGPGSSGTGGSSVGSANTAGSVNTGATSLPSTGAFLLIPAAGLMAVGMGALMMRKRLSSK